MYIYTPISSYKYTQILVLKNWISFRTQNRTELEFICCCNAKVKQKSVLKNMECLDLYLFSELEYHWYCPYLYNLCFTHCFKFNCHITMTSSIYLIVFLDFNLTYSLVLSTNSDSIFNFFNSCMLSALSYLFCLTNDD